jgi:hypothetical protein
VSSETRRRKEFSHPLHGLKMLVLGRRLSTWQFGSVEVFLKYGSVESYYSLRLILLFTNMDVSRYILVVDTSILVKSNMGRREYMT